MRLIVNQPLIKRRLRLSLVYFFLSTGLMAGGFLLTAGHQAEMEQELTRYVVAMVALLVGLGLWAMNQNYLTRWSPRSRQDAALARVLRGLDDRYHLFAFPASSLPDYLLVGPMGVHVLVTRATGGTVSCEGDRWRRIERVPLLLRALAWFSRTSPLGNPTAEARRGVEQTKRYLARRLPADLVESVPVEPLIVFMSPDLELTARGCSVPVLRAKSLRAHLRALPKHLRPEETRQLAAALGA